MQLWYGLRVLDVVQSGTKETVLELIELAALCIEVLAVGIIILSVVYATVRYGVHVLGARTTADSAYTLYKFTLARALLLGLEILVAADVVRTVALDTTIESVVVLGLLVFIRTFLSWSLVVETEGRWPWNRPCPSGALDGDDAEPGSEL
jgi:uncharacterized membrane protein